jgi:predicted Zn-dependent protease
MKTILKVLATAILLWVIFYQIDQVFGLRTLSLWNDIRSNIIGKYFPCKEPISYKLGSFDTKFKISQKDFLSAVKQAEDAWENAVGIDLFSYNQSDTSTDVLKMNLIYDYREQATEKLAVLGIAVKNTKASYDVLKAKHAEMKDVYESKKEELSTLVEIFEEKKSYYNQQVEYWNAKGGAPQKEYNRIEGLRNELELMSKELLKMQSEINELVDNINYVVVALNNIAKNINLAVKDYNTISTSRGETFEQGLYKSDGINRQIDIYEFSTKTKLLRVLIHEFGHAVGLDHIEDPKAIMYKLNESSDTKVTASDISALKALCRIE